MQYEKAKQDNEHTYLIFGCGITGKSAVSFCQRHGLPFYITDDNKETLKTLRVNGVLVEEDNKLYDYSEATLKAKQINYIVLSPHIKTQNDQHKIVEIAKNIGAEIQYTYTEKKLIGITGTNGKSTTTALVAHILNENGKPAVACGNIGVNLLSFTEEEVKKYDYFVVEMSSYNLVISKYVNFDVGGLINISPDHLDYHGTMEEYIKAKMKIFDLSERKVVMVGEYIKEKLSAKVVDMSDINKYFASQYDERLYGKKFFSLLEEVKSCYDKNETKGKTNFEIKAIALNLSDINAIVFEILSKFSGSDNKKFGQYDKRNQDPIGEDFKNNDGIGHNISISPVEINNDLSINMKNRYFLIKDDDGELFYTFEVYKFIKCFCDTIKHNQPFDDKILEDFFDDKKDCSKFIKWKEHFLMKHLPQQLLKKETAIGERNQLAIEYLKYIYEYFNKLVGGYNNFKKASPECYLLNTFTLKDDTVYTEHVHIPLFAVFRVAENINKEEIQVSFSSIKDEIYTKPLGDEFWQRYFDTIGIFNFILESKYDANGGITYSQNCGIVYVLRNNMLRCQDCHATNFDIMSFANKFQQNHIKNDELYVFLNNLFFQRFFVLTIYSDGIYCFSRKLSSISFPNLKGSHNNQNIVVAVGITHFCGVDFKQAFEAIKTFQGLEHRLQLIKTIEGIEFVNDSKGTNANSTEQALKAYKDYDVYLIAGGRRKEEGFLALKPYLACVKCVFLIGEATESFAKELDELSITYVKCGTMDVAVKKAFEMAKNNVNNNKKRVVLLSPLCASFDQYKSFEERGDAFCKIVDGISGITLDIEK